MFTNIAGIDVSKLTLDIFLSHSKQYLKINNQDLDIKELGKQLKEEGIELVILESTGGYENNLIELLQRAKLRVARVNPRQMRDFAKSQGILAKTDKLDSKVIAQYGLVSQPREVISLSNETKSLRSLLDRRYQLTEFIKNDKLRIDKIADKKIRSSINRHLKWLNKELCSIETKAFELLKSSNELQMKSKLLETVPGVAQITSATLLAYLPEIGSLNSKEISSLAGLAPFNSDSGTSLKKKRRIWGGRFQVKRVLYMASLVATRHNPLIKDVYLKLRNKGKPAKLALIACMRRLIVIMNSMMKYQKVWNYS